MVDFSFRYQEFEVLLLFIMRMGGFVYAAPFFSNQGVPQQFKIGLSVFLGYLTYYATMPHQYLQYTTLIEFSILVLKEVIVGILIGWAANICISIVFFAGRIVDMDIGFSMVNAMDPTTRENATITGFYYQYAVLLILLISGMHRYVLEAIVESYSLVPLGGVVFHLDKMYDALLHYLAEYVNIGFRICMPIFTVILVVNVVLGILAKVAPQMNMFAVGMQIKILVGLGVMVLTTIMLPYVADFIYTQTKIMVVSMVEAMIP
ncbi:MAG: flagellar biosynthetic protein FliR [Lachnospiraceae bacterium]|nr:flagellar biosynthetic protein FliR [Lachnospiraceae bacterium]